MTGAGYSTAGGPARDQRGQVRHGRDGLGDGLERGLRRGVKDPPGPVKGTGRRFRRGRDPRSTTSPLKRDTDRGGVPDGREDRNRNGRVDKGETNARKPGTG